MDKRTVVALVLIALIFIMLPYYWEWTGLSKKPSKEQQAQTQADTSLTAADSEAVSQAPLVEKATPDTLLDSISAHVPPVAQIDTLPEQFFDVKTDLYEAKVTSAGASISQFMLLKYKYNDGKPIEMIPRRDYYPLGFSVPGIKGLKSTAMHFTTDREHVDLTSGGQDSAVVTFTAVSGSQVPVTVTYTFRRDSYSIGYRVRVARISELTQVSKFTVQWLGGLDPTEPKLSDDYGYFSGYVRQGDEVAKFKKFEDGKLHESSTSGIDWVATKSKYFMVALRADNEFADEFDISATERKTVESGQDVAKRVFNMALTYNLQGDIEEAHTELYVGPVDYRILAAMGHDLHKVVELGWGPLQPFAIAILWIVNGLHKVIPNYGVVLIAFTILMKIVFFPFQRKNYRQMARMKALQPKLKALQEKYKEDPTRLNKEMMKFYKEEKFNPLGGCLWMLPQLPIFWALFTVFKASIDLRGASFLWIADLSQADLYLAIAMGVAMLLQQVLTNKDPKQKFMVYGFPIIMTFLFRNFPAGLVLYWTVFNIIGILEQKSVEATMARESQAAQSA